MIKKIILRLTSGILFALSLGVGIFSFYDIGMVRMYIPRKRLILYGRFIGFRGGYEVYYDVLAIAVLLFVTAMTLFIISVKKTKK